MLCLINAPDHQVHDKFPRVSLAGEEMQQADHYWLKDWLSFLPSGAFSIFAFRWHSSPVSHFLAEENCLYSSAIPYWRSKRSKMSVQH